MVGWEHEGDKQTDNGCMFNMILKDGTRSDNAMTFLGKVKQRYDYFLPQNKKITKVTIYYTSFIIGFRFHLSDGSEWCIGDIDELGVFGGQGLETVTVNIADNEAIVGFKSKSHPRCPANYVEWQFITA